MCPDEKPFAPKSEVVCDEFFDGLTALDSTDGIRKKLTTGENCYDPSNHSYDTLNKGADKTVQNPAVANAQQCAFYLHNALGAAEAVMGAPRWQTIRRGGKDDNISTLIFRIVQQLGQDIQLVVLVEKEYTT